MKNILILLFLFFYSNCQNYICKSDDSNDLKVGDKAYLCIHILETNKRVALPVVVDEYSVAAINGLYSQKSSNSTIQLLAQVGTTTSIFPSVSNYII